MNESAHNGPTRRAVICAGGSGVLGAGLGGCGFVTLMTQTFRFTVEDESGKVLGSGVWQWEENVPVKQYREHLTWDGEAFPIVHPALGKMYVTLGNNSGWGGGSAEDILKLYQKAGLIPEFERKAPNGGIGAEGFAHIARMTTRVELPLKGTPCFVQFTDERDPRTVRIVMTYSKTKPAEVVLRFFVQPTEDRVTTGIMNHLPWLRSLPSRVLNGGPGAFREKNFKSPRDADQVTDHEFVDRETAKQLNDARNSKM